MSPARRHLPEPRRMDALQGGTQGRGRGLEGAGAGHRGPQWQTRIWDLVPQTMGSRGRILSCLVEGRLEGVKKRQLQDCRSKGSLWDWSQSHGTQTGDHGEGRLEGVPRGSPGAAGMPGQGPQGRLGTTPHLTSGLRLSAAWMGARGTGEPLQARKQAVQAQSPVSQWFLWTWNKRDLGQWP